MKGSLGLWLALTLTVLLATGEPRLFTKVVDLAHYFVDSQIREYRSIP